MTTIALIGCSKTKAIKSATGWAPARDLYSSDLFTKRVKHVEARGLPWYILSAKSGLLKPTVDVRLYDKTISDLCPLEVAEWHLGVANQLMSEFWYEFNITDPAKVTIELHAGAKYCEPLGNILQLLGVTVVKPVVGLGIGKQKAFYADFAKEHSSS
jgi:hypothetical protein